MGSFNFDEMEELYTRSVLSENKKNKKRKKNNNETKVIFISLLIATAIIVILFNTMGNKKVELEVNNDLVDEIVYQVVEKEKSSNIEEFEKIEIEEKKEETEKKEAFENHYVIQVLASKDRNSVDKEVKRIFQKGEEVYRIKEGKSFYKILIDKKFKSRDEADEYAKNLKERKIVKSYWVRFVSGKE